MALLDGDQPLYVDRDTKEIAFICNGEIYNHEAWGT